MSVWATHAARSVPTSTAPTSATADRATTSGRMGTPVKVGPRSVTHHKYRIGTKRVFEQVHASISHDLLPLCAPPPPTQDINECSQSIGQLCTYKCVNVPGSYRCACPEYGYTMSPNGRSCRGEPRTTQMHPLTALCLTEFCSEIDFNKMSLHPFALHRLYSNGYAQINIIGTFTVAL